MFNQIHWNNEGSSIGICFQPKMCSIPCTSKHSKELYGYEYPLLSKYWVLQNVRLIIVSEIIHERKKHIDHSQG